MPAARQPVDRQQRQNHSCHRRPATATSSSRSHGSKCSSNIMLPRTTSSSSTTTTTTTEHTSIRAHSARSAHIAQSRAHTHTNTEQTCNERTNTQEQSAGPVQHSPPPSYRGARIQPLSLPGCCRPAATGACQSSLLVKLLRRKRWRNAGRARRRTWDRPLLLRRACPRRLDRSLDPGGGRLHQLHQLHQTPKHPPKSTASEFNPPTQPAAPAATAAPPASASPVGPQRPARQPPGVSESPGRLRQAGQ